jgi:opacity protein-like surface antigen
MALAAAPTLACAQTQTPTAYIEGSVGVRFSSDVQTKNYTFVVPPDTASGHAELNYGTNVVIGAELGIADLVGDGNWRFGVSYDYTQFNLDSVRFVGTVNGVPGSVTVSDSDVRSAGFNFDNTVHIVMGNIYYNLPVIRDAFRPYVGLGAGAAFIEHADTEFAFNVSAGIRMALGPSAYVGLRYRFIRVEGPTDELGIQYKPITAHTISAVVGFYFP